MEAKDTETIEPLFLIYILKSVERRLFNTVILE